MHTLRAEFLRLVDQYHPSSLPDPGMERIHAIQRVVAMMRPARIDGSFIEPAIAAMILATYRSLTPENQAKYRSVSAGRMGSIAMSQEVEQAA